MNGHRTLDSHTQREYTNRMKRWALGVFIVAVLSAGMGSPASAQPVTTTPVILYGDSMTVQAREFIHGATVRAQGGYAICDWFAQMRADAKLLHPAFVVLALDGNWRANQCMRTRLGIPATADSYLLDVAQYADRLTELYTEDIATAVSIFHGAKVWGILPPPLRHDDRQWTVNAYEASGLPLVDVRSMFVDSQGNYAERLPCRPGETIGCTNGIAQLRSPTDGAHFCDGAPNPCPPDQSAGARRYGAALSHSIPLRFGQMLANPTVVWHL